MKRTILSLAAMLCGVLLAACATQIKPSTKTNPPPLETFSSFDRFELKRVELSATYAGQEANEKAAARIREYFDQRIKPLVERWNGKTTGGGRTLVIEPYIEHIKFIGGGARFFVGPMAGSSAVVMKVKYFDKESGKVIAEPEFYQHAAAMSGAMTFGGQDNAMLARIVSLIEDYSSQNYNQRVGGTSGDTP